MEQVLKQYYVKVKSEAEQQATKLAISQFSKLKQLIIQELPTDLQGKIKESGVLGGINTSNELIDRKNDSIK